MDNENTKCLNAYYQASGFIVDMEPAPKKAKITEADEKAQQDWYERFHEDKYGALYHMGFLVKQAWMTSSVAYLHRISELLIRRLSQQPELELMREETAAELKDEELDLSLIHI